MSSVQEPHFHLEVGHILFLDIVGSWAGDYSFSYLLALERLIGGSPQVNRWRRLSVEFSRRISEECHCGLGRFDGSRFPSPPNPAIPPKRAGSKWRGHGQLCAGNARRRVP